MPYIGRGLTSGAQYQKLDAITIDNATTFTMQVSSTAVTPPQEHVILAVNGVLQEPGVGFTVAGSTCTLASAIDNDGGTDTIWGVVAGAAAFNNGLFGNTVTVGEDDTGYDVKFFGATSGQYMLWDESADELVLAGDSKLSFHDAAGGENIIASANGHLEINSGTTLDITAPTVDINAETLVQVDGPVSVVVDDTGHDVKFFGATASAYMLWDESADDLILAGAGGLSVAGTSALAGVSVSGDIDMDDDKGIIFGSGDDWFFGAGAGEAYLGVFMGSSQGPTATGGEIKFLPYDSTGYDTKMFVVGAEGGEARLFLYSDQGDDTSDQWSFDAHPNDGDMFLNVGSNTADETFKWTSGGSGHADDVWEDNTWDYAELFEWKTHLASDAAVKDLYGMSVVLDGDKVRVAELGEEDKILGVVRPKGSTAAHGDGLKWQKKYIRNVWGEYEEEGYTMVSWQEFLPNGNVSYRHAYHKDEIPEYRLNDGIGRDKENYTKEENFSLDKDGEKIPVIVPSTEEEKTAANYIERTTHKTSGKTLTRRKYNDDYDPSIPYIGRAARLKEWVLIGLLGQVPVRTSAVIPDHWVKQKDLESGIDFYYIFNK